MSNFGKQDPLGVQFLIFFDDFTPFEHVYIFVVIITVVDNFSGLLSKYFNYCAFNFKVRTINY